MEFTSSPLPYASRSFGDVPGHWLLARLGKRFLRPGGRELTERLLARAGLTGSDVVELAPGLGKTARLILDAHPRSYLGVDADAQATALCAEVVGDRGRVITSPAAHTGLEDASADVVLGEAMLTMHSERGKREIIAEAARVLRPGGRYAIHELSLTPDSLDAEVKTTIRRALARSIKVNARPLTDTEWTELLAEHGFTIESIDHAPMALLEPRRMISDEGVRGTARIVGNVLRQPAARRRIRDMRRVFSTYRDHLAAISIVATKAADGTEGIVEAKGAVRTTDAEASVGAATVPGTVLTGLADGYSGHAPVPERTVPELSVLERLDGATVIRLAFRPGDTMADHCAPHPILVFGQSGSVGFTIGAADDPEAEHTTLEPGRAVHVAAHQVHSLTAAEPATVTLVLLT